MVSAPSGTATKPLTIRVGNPAARIIAANKQACSILIEVEHAGIRAKVEELTNGLQNEVDKLKVIQKFVYEHMEDKNYSKAMASAADAFESGEGDCTEHACLLAATPYCGCANEKSHGDNPAVMPKLILCPDEPHL